MASNCALHKAHIHFSRQMALIKYYYYTSCLKKSVQTYFFVRTLSNFDLLWNFLAQR